MAGDGGPWHRRWSSCLVDKFVPGLSQVLLGKCVGQWALRTAGLRCMDREGCEGTGRWLEARGQEASGHSHRRSSWRAEIPRSGTH